MHKKEDELLYNQIKGSEMNLDENQEHLEMHDKLIAFKNILSEKSNMNTQTNLSKNISLSDPRRPSIMAMNRYYLREKINCLNYIKKIHNSQFTEINSNKGPNSQSNHSRKTNSVQQKNPEPANRNEYFSPTLDRKSTIGCDG